MGRRQNELALLDGESVAVLPMYMALYTILYI
jgi:hypothetical protein